MNFGKASSVSVVSANTLNVSSEISEGNYTSIQGAMEHALSGDQIIIFPGLYTENVVVNLPNIRIISASGNPEDTIVQARNASESVFCVHASDNRICGITIQGSSRAGIELDSSDCNAILSNRISENPTGILLNSSDGNTIYRNYIEENLEGITMLDSDASMVAENVIDTNAFAVTLVSSENNAFSRNKLEENTLGFTLLESKDNNIVENTINKSQTAFTLNLSDSNSFSRNVLINNPIGFMVEESEDNGITENTMITSSINVIMNSSVDNCFSGNEFTNTSLGFMLIQSENNEISGNNVNNSSIAILTSSSGVNKFSENLFINSTIGFLLLQSEENELTENLLLSNRIGVLESSGENNTLSGNTITDTIYGIQLLDSDNSEVKGNIVNISEISLLIDSGRDNKVSENIFSNTLIGTMIIGADNSSLSLNEFSSYIYGAMAIRANKSTLGDNNFSGVFSDFTPENSPGNLIGGSLNRSSLLKDIKLFNENEILQVNNLLKQHGLSKQNNVIKQNPIFKGDASLYDIVSFGQEDLFNENESQENEQEVGLLNNSGLNVFKELSDEHWTFGVYLKDMNNSVLEGNKISDNYCGVFLSGSQNCRLSENWLKSNYFGFVLNESNGILVYDNYFNNTNNTAFDDDAISLFKGIGNESNDESNLTCTWNLNKTKGLNVVGGPYIGGNYWALPNGTGFSQTQQDADKDGICDLPYYINEDGLNTDFLPLANAPEMPDNCAGGREGKNNYQNGSSQADSSQSNLSGDSSQSNSSGDSSQSNYTSTSYQNGSPGGSSSSSTQKYLPQPSNNAEGADSLQKKIISGTETEFKFDNPMNDVSRISFKSEKYSGIVETRVETVDVNKTDIVVKPGQRAYRYVKILVGNKAFESSENIAGGSIEFRVLKSWVKENGVNSGTICLSRLEDNGLKLLETKLMGEDEAFYYFTAKTPGFSCFAITGKQQAVTALSEQQTSIMPKEQKAENPIKSEESAAAKGQATAGNSTQVPGSGMILSGACIFLSWAYLKRR